MVLGAATRFACVRNHAVILAYGESESWRHHLNSVKSLLIISLAQRLRSLSLPAEAPRQKNPSVVVTSRRAGEREIGEGGRGCSSNGGGGGGERMNELHEGRGLQTLAWASQRMFKRDEGQLQILIVPKICLASADIEQNVLYGNGIQILLIIYFKRDTHRGKDTDRQRERQTDRHTEAERKTEHGIRKRIQPHLHNKRYNTIHTQYSSC